MITDITLAESIGGFKAHLMFFGPTLSGLTTCFSGLSIDYPLYKPQVVPDADLQEQSLPLQGTCLGYTQTRLESLTFLKAALAPAMTLS